MAELRLNVNLVTRPAIYRPNKYRAQQLGIEEGSEIHVDVLGIFQYKDGDEADAAFIVEYPDGKCDYAAVTEVQFTDKEDADDDADCD